MATLVARSRSTEFSSTVTKESLLTVYVVPSTKVMRAAPSPLVRIKSPLSSVVR